MKIVETITAFLAFVASLVSGVIFPGKATSVTLPTVKSASMFITSDTSFPTIGGILPVDIKLNLNGLSLSAAALRVVYKYIGTLPILPQDADVKVEGIQAKQNYSLLEKGWVFPVNEIIHDPKAKLITVDFAAVNLNPEGYSSAEDVTLATLDLQVTALAPRVTFNFDKSQTKVISKEGEAVKLQLKPGEFAIQ
jgi:hypothetical protein